MDLNGATLALRERWMIGFILRPLRGCSACGNFARKKRRKFSPDVAEIRSDGLFYYRDVELWDSRRKIEYYEERHGGSRGVIEKRREQDASLQSGVAKKIRAGEIEERQN